MYANNLDTFALEHLKYLSMLISLCDTFLNDFWTRLVINLTIESRAWLNP
jgi:hypothetical protein